MSNNTLPIETRIVRIDALRAVAVVSVMVFHLSEEVFPGGWLGVDIFLVISGFLMASIIENGCTSSGFIFRRMARILPPAYAVITVALLIHFCLGSDQRVIGVPEVISTLGFLSNFFYFLNVDYFTGAAGYSFLHYWSLALEVQFYFLLAFFVRIASGRFWLYLCVLSLAVSFALGYSLMSFFSAHSEQELLNGNRLFNFSFYLLPARIWEFGAGGLAFYISMSRYNKAVPRLVWWFIFAFLLAVITQPPSDRLLSQILAVGLSCLLIVFIPPGQFMLKKLSILGRPSYSIYLVHLPLVMFLSKYLQGYVFILVGLLGSIALGLVNYFISEKYLSGMVRKGGWRWLAGLSVLFYFFVFLILTVRTDPKIEAFDLAAHKEASNSFKAFASKAYRSQNYSEFEATEKRKVLFIGDSTASDLLGGALLSNKLKDGFSFLRLGLSHKCHFGDYDRENMPRFSKDVSLARSCDMAFRDLVIKAGSLAPDIIVVSFNWYDKVRVRGLGFVNVPIKEPLREALALLRSALPATKIVVFGKRLAWTKNVKESPVESFIQSDLSISDYERRVFDTVTALGGGIDSELRESVVESSGLFYDFLGESFCDMAELRCRVFGLNGIYWRDSIHWTEEGAVFYVEDMFARLNL